MKRLYLGNGRWSESETDSVSWIRAGQARGEDWADLAQTHGLHPLAIEDVQNPRQRPKVEDYEGHTFVMLRVPRGRDPDAGWQQVGVWILENTVITASPEMLPELDAVEARICKRKNVAPNASTLAYLILDALVDTWFPFMDTLEQEAEAVEDSAMDAPTPEVLSSIRELKHIASRTRKLLAPMRTAMSSLERGDHATIAPEIRVYLRDISDHTIRLAERLDHVREVTLIAQETWNSALANQQNQVMKRLTVIAALLLIPGLLAGLGGMNFEGIPNWNYWAVTASILGFIAVGFSVSAWRRWL